MKKKIVNTSFVSFSEGKNKQDLLPKLTMLHKERRQTSCTANNHRNTQNPTTSEVSEARPKEDICREFNHTRKEEVEDFISALGGRRRGSLLSNLS
jgi:hypothetical protein